MAFYNPWQAIKKILPRTLFARSLLIIVIPVVLLQVVVTTVFVDNHWRKVTSRMSFAVAGEIAIMADMMGDEFNPELLASLKILGERRLGFLVTAEPGRKLTPGVETSGTWEPFTVNALAGQLEEQVGRPFYLSFGPEDKWADISIQMPWGVFRVFALERRLFSTSSYIFLLWMIGSSLILFTIAVIFMRNQIRPIHRLAIAAERLGMGRDIPNFKPEGAREVRSAARAFLNMHERIRRQMEQRTAMLAGISHDLRTPLTRLKLGLSMLPESKDREALKGDVSDMERMINSYLDFVRDDSREAAIRVNLKDIIDKCVEAASRHGKHIESNLQDDLFMQLRPVGFERVLQNLVSNAEKYANKIWIDIRKDDEDVIISIEDDGKGLPANEMEEVFKPFYRADQSRNTATGGVGLGLPIARDIIHSHGGQIWLEKGERKGGLKAVIRLPF